jgi:hypothetical protein
VSINVSKLKPTLVHFDSSIAIGASGFGGYVSSVVAKPGVTIEMTNGGVVIDTLGTVTWVPAARIKSVTFAPSLPEEK